MKKSLEIMVSNVEEWDKIGYILKYYGFWFEYHTESPFSNSVYENWSHPKLPYWFEIRISDHQNNGTIRNLEIGLCDTTTKNVFLMVRKFIKSLLKN